MGVPQAQGPRGRTGVKAGRADEYCISVLSFRAVREPAKRSACVPQLQGRLTTRGVGLDEPAAYLAVL